ncbi:MAG TPA: hypothetical protein QGH56_07910 [Candidatus Marinimicrobia bacterium]|nr:hypothetical protein [Candidatus Neomarinimicrobiota bacterium]
MSGLLKRDYGISERVIDEIYLNAGWNLISFDTYLVEYPFDSEGVYLENFPAPADVFAEIINADNLVVITGYDNGAHIFNPAFPPFLNSLTSIEPGKGYWVKVIVPQTLTVGGVNEPDAPECYCDGIISDCELQSECYGEWTIVDPVCYCDNDVWDCELQSECFGAWSYEDTVIEWPVIGGEFSIDLLAGWNLIGYHQPFEYHAPADAFDGLINGQGHQNSLLPPPGYDETVEGPWCPDPFYSPSNNLIVATGYNNGAIIFNPDFPPFLNSLEYMAPSPHSADSYGQYGRGGGGYWVKVNEPVCNFKWPGVPSLRSPSAPRRSAKPPMAIGKQCFDDPYTYCPPPSPAMSSAEWYSSCCEELGIR